MMGMLVIGSTINPLMVISTSTRLPGSESPLESTTHLERTLARRRLGRNSLFVRVASLTTVSALPASGRCLAPTRAGCGTASPHKLCGPARWMVTSTNRPTHSGRPGKFTTVLPDVRPDSSQSRRRLRESTSTSTRWPTAASCSSC